MADEAVEETGKKSNKMVLILIILAVVLIGVLGAGAAWFFLMNDEPASQETAVVEEVKKKDAIYIKLRTMDGKPYFLANLATEKFGTQRFIQIFAEARTREESVQEAVGKHMPLIVHRLTTLYSSQTLADMQSAEGKERLRTESTRIIQAIMQDELGSPGIEDVFFTNFVMQ